MTEILVGKMLGGVLDFPFDGALLGHCVGFGLGYLVATDLEGIAVGLMVVLIVSLTLGA